MKKIKLTINGRKVILQKGASVLEGARKAEIYVPTLCDDPDLEPFGACRLCIVQIKGLRGLPPSCTTPAEEGMEVLTETDEIQSVRRTIVELAIANHPYDCLVCGHSEGCELLKVARYVGVDKMSVDRCAGQL